eukprot:Nk52_evm19s307 gene=Nk52_evmTU19s307
MSYRNKIKRTIEIPKESSSYSVTRGGTFSEGDMNINREGISFGAGGSGGVGGIQLQSNSNMNRMGLGAGMGSSFNNNNSNMSSSISPLHNMSSPATVSPSSASNNNSNNSNATPTSFHPHHQFQSPASSSSAAGGLDSPAGSQVSPSQKLRNMGAPQSPSNALRKLSPSLEVKLQDLKILEVIGRGSGGVVQRALHIPTDCIFAVKVIPLDVTDKVRKQILFELRTLYEAQSPHIVRFHGAFFNEGSISMVLEFMDGGSLTELLARRGAIPEPVIASIAQQVLHGLVYLHKHRHLIHRDIKPQNLLLNTKGEIKISDFGVSGQLASTISSCVSWVGTVTYMSPERIQGKSYSVMSDIWSFGLSIMELAMGEFPYQMPSGNNNNNQQQPAGFNMGFWELLDYIVEKPVPVLDSAKFSSEFCDFVHICLRKEPRERPSAHELLDHPFLSKYGPVDIKSWLGEDPSMSSGSADGSVSAGNRVSMEGSGARSGSVGSARSGDGPAPMET